MDCLGWESLSPTTRFALCLGVGGESSCNACGYKEIDSDDLEASFDLERDFR